MLMIKTTSLQKLLIQATNHSHSQRFKHLHLWAYQFTQNPVCLIQKGNSITHQIHLIENVSSPSKNSNLNPCLTSLPDYEQAHSLPLSSYQHKIRAYRETQNKIEPKYSIKAEKFELK